MKIELKNTYADLPEVFYQKISPTPVKAPYLIQWNTELADLLGISREDESDLELAHYFSGNKLLPGSRPLAMAYAGHQFAHSVPQLGDGRAHLLAEIVNKKNMHFDLQLKGSGPTQFSRSGDGRAALGPMLREYIVSEYMNALKIPTTRSLALVATGENVQREGLEPGGILTRVAASHIRVGTFEYFYLRNDFESLKVLADYVINRHYPQAYSQKSITDSKYMQLFQKIIDKQALLLAKWMSVGFIHGVMNTDNMAISGETIDYGPCAFMDEFDPEQVFSSIDQNGRYAFINQPPIAQWNLSILASCFTPLLIGPEDVYLTELKTSLENFKLNYEKNYLEMMSKKLGFSSSNTDVADLTTTFLSLLHQSKTDYTLAFRYLASLLKNETAEFSDYIHFIKNKEWPDWQKRWQELLSKQNRTDLSKVAAEMDNVNPIYIARNHLVEKAIRSAVDSNDFSFFRNWQKILSAPYTEKKYLLEFALPPADNERITETFCGT